MSETGEDEDALSDGAPLAGEDPVGGRGRAAGKPVPPAEMLTVADDMCTRAAAGLHHAIEEMRRGTVDELRQTTAAVKELRAAMTIAMLERSKVGKLRRDEDGVADSHALDLDQARAEIARRLDLIGRAG